ncbi:hypothetical protein BpHYR1_042434 [Brachionus plicatilis]|uniref:Uncharacterized protein n=1 Tax=Brachionus plicatilis TaxID=10195 RepID=A0A3M7QWC2_BRAPC|nr:hypothetical protein BpHYR1_042434 [Brachionus plicatilis]
MSHLVNSLVSNTNHSPFHLVFRHRQNLLIKTNFKKKSKSFSYSIEKKLQIYELLIYSIAKISVFIGKFTKSEVGSNFYLKQSYFLLIIVKKNFISIFILKKFQTAFKFEIEMLVNDSQKSLKQKKLNSLRFMNSV